MQACKGKSSVSDKNQKHAHVPMTKNQTLRFVFNQVTCGLCSGTISPMESCEEKSRRHTKNQNHAYVPTHHN